MEKVSYGLNKYNALSVIFFIHFEIISIIIVKEKKSYIKYATVLLLKLLRWTYSIVQQTNHFCMISY